MNKYLTLALMVGSLMPSLSYSVPTSFDNKVKAGFSAAAVGVPMVVLGGGGLYAALTKDITPPSNKMILGAVACTSLVIGLIELREVQKEYEKAEKARIEEELKHVK